MTVGRCRWKAFCIRRSLNVVGSEIIHEFWLVGVFSVRWHRVGPRSGFDLTKREFWSSQWPLVKPLNVTCNTRTMTKCCSQNSLWYRYVEFGHELIDGVFSIIFPWCPRTRRYAEQVEHLINVSPSATWFDRWQRLSGQRQYLREPRRLLMTIQRVHRSMFQIRLVVYKPRCECNPLARLIN